ncbi:MAG TPA: ferric reductase-like transmembrane domain-containing protein [Ilumatobacteraceae bacterium]|nr:ferric reductase-like transmembrane domain-containing protein [Ilumatobacteraceae bacterium]HRB04651.1 ferric reductase-like transmembrane domain-containing protein [Ilumatobacteraceae bacterium]
MESLMWYLTRATGIVAAVLAVAALVWGLFFSARNTGNRLRPNWWLALHNYLGGLTLAFIGLHMLVSFLDTNSGLHFLDLLIPSGDVGWDIGWGVLAFWSFAIVVLPSVARIRRRLPRRAWHAVHLLAIPAIVLTGVHAYQSGSDSASKYFTVGLAVLIGMSVYPITIRLLGIEQHRRSTAGRSLT